MNVLLVSAESPEQNTRNIKYFNLIVNSLLEMLSPSQVSVANVFGDVAVDLGIKV